MSNDGLLWLICILLFILIVAFPVPVKSHESPSGWEYDYECCHNKDCGPIISVRPSSDPNQSLIITKHGSGITADSTKKKQSKDDKDHACIVYGHVVCIYEAAKY